MLNHDLSHWPLAVTVARGAPTLQEMEAFLAAWDQWLDRGEPFACLRVFADADSLTHPAGGAQQARQWLQRRGADIRNRVLGMANVVPAAHYEKMRKVQIEKLFGVPGDTFLSPEDALHWLRRSAFAPRGLSLDIAAAQARIAAAAAAHSPTEDAAQREGSR